MDDISPIEKEDIENKIIDWIDVGSSDRLIIFKPQNNKKSIDLIVKKKGEYKAKEISLQINGSATPVTGPDFIKDIGQDSFVPDKALYLIFVYFDEIKQDISSYFWVVPSLFFRDSVEPIKLPDKKIVMRFQASTDLKKQNKYSRFLVNKKDLGKILLKIIDSKDNFEFSGPGDRIINLQNIKKFIVQARQNTFAGNGVAIDDPRLSGSEQFEFQKADLFYRDIYFSGEKSFIGQEIVYQNNDPIWGMNYFGEPIGKEALAFLKTSLSELSDKCRFGENCEFEKREFKYQDQGAGTLENFSGKEQILQKGKNIYNLTYRGGLI